MVPEETSNPGAESLETPARTESAIPPGRRSGRRRGRRGRGRPQRQRALAPDPASAPPEETVLSAAPLAVPAEHAPPETTESALEEPPETGPSLPPELEADIGAPAPVTDLAETAPPERPVRPPAPHHRPPQPAPRATVQQLIDDVNDIIETLRKSVEEMEAVLEGLEVIERQEGASEREIESLRHALRQLQRPRDGGGPRQRGR